VFPEQQNSAADLSMLVLESLEKSGAKIDDETLGEFIENVGDFGKHCTVRGVVIF